MSDKIKRYKAYIIEALLFIALLAVDLISKPVAFAFLEKHGGSYVVYEGIYELIEVHNDGASFGIFGGKTAGLIAVTAIAMVALVALLIWRPKSPKLFRYGVIAIVAGGVGNLVDRLAFGYVRDFIDYTFLKTFFGIDNFGVGNIADIFVLVGLLCIVVYVFFGYKEGDFAKEPKNTDDLPETLVVNEGEEKKADKEKQRSGVTESVEAGCNTEKNVLTNGSEKDKKTVDATAVDGCFDGNNGKAVCKEEKTEIKEQAESLVGRMTKSVKRVADSDKAD